MQYKNARLPAGFRDSEQRVIRVSVLDTIKAAHPLSWLFMGEDNGHYATVIAEDQSLEMPILTITDGALDIRAGRHRLKHLNEAGYTSVDVVVPREVADQVQALVGAKK